ncbi:MAG: hemolysin III family protein [Alphaproteobacteria bacterium]|nr:hemolysin III family protein [Alphaproteobacteria bacterium]
MSAPQSARSNVYKAYSQGEMWADISAHAVGITSGLVGTLVLMFTAGASGSFLLILGASLYAVGLLSMLGFSAAYNLWPPSPVKEMLRRFDHAAIFVMIAGTLTPFVMNRVGGAWGFGLLAFAWCVAVAGVAMKLVFPRRWERMTIALYIGLGLSILVVAGPLTEVISPTSAWLLFAGGATYILGVVFHLWERLPYQNAIWHWMVLTAAVLHYTAVLNEVSAAAL